MKTKLQNVNKLSVQPLFKRALLALAIAGVAATACGCLSVHVHKDEEKASPVIVVPSDHPNP